MTPVFEVKTVLFDLDGTLVDSIPDLAWAVDQTCAELGLPPRGIESVRQWVGNGIRTLVGRVLANAMTPSADTATVDVAYEVFSRHYATHCCTDSMVYPTVQDTLVTLKETGYNLAVITNKQTCFTERTMMRLGWENIFDLVLSFDSLPHAKPHPLPLRHAIETLGGPAIFVGDSATDVAAARNAEIPIIAMSYGYNHGDPIDVANPDVVIDQMRQLLSHITPHAPHI